MVKWTAFLAAPTIPLSTHPLPTTPTNLRRDRRPHLKPPNVQQRPRRFRASVCPFACTTAPPPQQTPPQQELQEHPPSTATIYFPPSSRGEKLLAKYTHPLPIGTRKLAEDRGVPLHTVSEGYGHILAATLTEDVPITPDIDALSNALHQTLTPTTNTSLAEDSNHNHNTKTKANLTLLSHLISRANDKSDTLSSADITTLSTQYGTMLADTLTLSGLELNVDAVVTGLRARISDASTPFPMPRSKYDEAFNVVQSCAATAAGTAAVDAADVFFAQLREEEGENIDDLQGDGYILSINDDDDVDAKINETPNRNVSTGESRVTAAIRARLLDGRTVLEAIPSSPPKPSPSSSPSSLEGDVSSDGEDGGNDAFAEALSVNVADMPHAFASALTGVAAGDKRMVLYHPYAAHEILPLFVPEEQVPPQAGLVIDLHILRVE